ncbi:amino acid ABC transporter permease [Shumkonia mesophila]|uniref:amino acid ABC transporter permease n=1 Tax=Shumkonia mesophila TaxID=2838854 RepID=UPI00293465B6|nr:amino acid ABC transporter permease [Shumkonia mesophila]
MMGAFDFGAIARALPYLWDGMQLSLLLTGLSAAGSIVLGTILALMRLSGIRPLEWIGAIWVNFFRSLPLLLVIFWFYFLVPLIAQRQVDAFQSALVGFVLFEAAYYCEIMRSGIQSISRGQAWAGYALGLRYSQTMRFIVLPQAFRNMLPVLLTQTIILFQDTSLVFVVGLADFMTSAVTVAQRDGRLMELYVFAAAVYFLMCYASSLYVKFLRRKMHQ